jgi:hypothetical protein
MEFIYGAIVLLIGILVGFYLGKGSSLIPEETQKQVKRLIQSLPIKHDVGAVERPSAKMVEDFNNPIKKAGDEEMSKTFSEIVK